MLSRTRNLCISLQLHLGFSDFCLYPNLGDMQPMGLRMGCLGRVQLLLTSQFSCTGGEQQHIGFLLTLFHIFLLGVEMTEENLSQFNDDMNLRHRLSGSCAHCKAKTTINKNTCCSSRACSQPTRQCISLSKVVLFSKAVASEPINLWQHRFGVLRGGEAAQAPSPYLGRKRRACGRGTRAELIVWDSPAWLLM